MRTTTRITVPPYLLLAALLVVLTGCPSGDEDGDGFGPEEDCDDSDAAIHPDADEVCDGLDNDCDGTVDGAGAIDTTTWYSDVDGDGYGDAADSVQACEQPAGRVLSSTDCDDLEAEANPGLAETTCNGVDDDCDAATLDEPDADADGSTVCDDCDDTDEAVSPLETETTCNGVDDDCDATTLDEPDADADGSTVCDDCDDTDDAVSPLETETTCNGVDDDCDAATPDEPDADADGSTVCDDCDDTDDAVSPLETETTCNGVDDDCDAATLDEPDADADGSTVCDDCDDADAAIHPGATEVTCDLVDNDCDATTVDGPDADSDGHTLCLDCDDTDPTVYPGAYDDCDGVDTDCSGTADDGDADTDGYLACDDCDDNDAAVNPGVTYDVCDAVDDDCSGTADDGDADGDLSTACDDCDDSDAAVYPGAIELCDGINNDCDADTDEADAADALTWYLDDDGDGQGDDAASEIACYQPSNHVLSDEDCDDGDPAIYLGADEVCDGSVDENCNGFVDDGCTTIDHCGTITSDETWGPMEVHHLTCNVSVEGGSAPTLTIEDWTTVTFASDVGLYVGNYNAGELRVTGTGWVTFTSDDDTSPSAGDWRGLYFGQYNTDSEVTGATIEYGGSNLSGNLQVYHSDVVVTDSVSRYSATHGLYAQGASELEISGSTFSDNDLDGVHLADGTALADGSAPTFTGNVLTGNSGYAMRLPADSVGELDASSTFVGNDDDGVKISGTVVADATWQAIDVPLVVTVNVSIEGASSPEVTVEDGLTVAFESDTGLYIGNYNAGALFVQGGATGVLFTSWDDTPSPGDWRGLYFGNYDTGSEVTGATVEYGGSNLSGSLQVYYSDVVVTDSVSRYSSTHGLYAQGTSELEISGSTFSDNDLDGVHLADGTALADGSAPTFTGNVLTGNSGYAMRLPADSVGELDASSTFVGNDDDGVKISGTVVADATWQAIDVPLVVTVNVSIEGASSPEVIVEDGLTVAFESGTGLYIGNYNAGALFVQGGATGVLFTSWDDTPNSGDWRGLYFGNYDTGSEVTGATVEYGGSNLSGNLHVYHCDVAVTDSVSRYSATHGFYAQGTSELEISGSTFSDNDLDGVHLATGTALVDTAAPSFTGNTLTGNDGFPLTIPANSGGMVDANCTFVGNDDDAVAVSGTVTDDAVWQAIDVPWLVTSNVSVEGVSSPELIVDDGATVMFEDGTGLYIGNYNSGALYVDGVTTGVVFTAWDDTPSAGDWLGVYFGNYDTGSDILGLHVSYGGGNGYGNLYFWNADGAVTDSTVSWSSTWGIYRSSANPTLTNIVYSDNDSGDLY
jgi:hypothetical protein